MSSGLMEKSGNERDMHRTSPSSCVVWARSTKSLYSKRRNHMTTFDTLMQRNKDFAAQQSATGSLQPSLPSALPHVKALIIGCADMRVDPAHVLGLKPGEAVVMSNIGGRITPGTLKQIGLLGRIAQVAEARPGGGGEI